MGTASCCRHLDEPLDDWRPMFWRLFGGLVGQVGRAWWFTGMIARRVLPLVLWAAEHAARHPPRPRPPDKPRTPHPCRGPWARHRAL
jgi:hypothetical protein